MLKVSSSRDARIGRTKSLISSLEASLFSSFFASSFFSPASSVVLPPSAGFSSVVPPPPQPLSTRDLREQQQFGCYLFCCSYCLLPPLTLIDLSYIATSVPFAGQNLLPMQMPKKSSRPISPLQFGKRQLFLNADTDSSSKQTIHFLMISVSDTIIISKAFIPVNIY